MCFVRRWPNRWWTWSRRWRRSRGARPSGSSSPPSARSGTFSTGSRYVWFHFDILIVIQIYSLNLKNYSKTRKHVLNLWSAAKLTRNLSLECGMNYLKKQRMRVKLFTDLKNWFIIFYSLYSKNGAHFRIIFISRLIWHYFALTKSGWSLFGHSSAIKDANSTNFGFVLLRTAAFTSKTQDQDWIFS